MQNDFKAKSIWLDEWKKNDTQNHIPGLVSFFNMDALSV